MADLITKELKGCLIQLLLLLLSTTTHAARKAHHITIQGTPYNNTRHTIQLLLLLLSSTTTHAARKAHNIKKKLKGCLIQLLLPLRTLLWEAHQIPHACVEEINVVMKLTCQCLATSARQCDSMTVRLRDCAAAQSQT